MYGIYCHEVMKVFYGNLLVSVGGSVTVKTRSLDPGLHAVYFLSMQSAVSAEWETF